ncbi:Hypothetical Protein XCAW_01712 [Xanthomonas citri subsp. citri Aw12879]|nr:Hypothetical Protein XCAW_01712 [Xanthomonas citri subsp. citri Aw12879]
MALAGAHLRTPGGVFLVAVPVSEQKFSRFMIALRV